MSFNVIFWSTRTKKDFLQRECPRAVYIASKLMVHTKRLLFVMYFMLTIVFTPGAFKIELNIVRHITIKSKESMMVARKFFTNNLYSDLNNLKVLTAICRQT